MSPLAHAFSGHSTRMYIRWVYRRGQVVEVLPETQQRATTEEASSEVRASRLNLRVTSRQAALIRRAAESRDKTVTEFVLESASTAAEQVLADRRWFSLDEDAWETFDTLLDRPVVFKPRLSETLNQADPFVD